MGHCCVLLGTRTASPGVLDRCDDNKLREFIFQQLAVFVGVVKQHVRGYLDQLFRVRPLPLAVCQEG